MQVFFEHEILKRSLCAFYLVIALRHFLEQIFKQKIKELKSDCRLYK